MVFSVRVMTAPGRLVADPIGDKPASTTDPPGRAASKRQFLQFGQADRLEGAIRAAPAGQVADVLQDVIAARAGNRSRRTAAPAPSLAGVGIDGDDGRRAAERRALQDVQADAAAAEDDDALARLNGRGVERRADAGRHRAADQRGGRQRNVAADGDAAWRRHDGVFGEGG